MNAFLLAALFACGQKADDTNLHEILDKDYQALLKAEPRPHALRAAARHLQETNRSSHWMSYFSAIENLRKSRSKAGIPLTLKYMLLHEAGNFGNLDAYASGLTILTGEDVNARIKALENPKVPRLRAVETFVNAWWLAKKDQINTDLGKMSREQLDLVAERLVGQAQQSLRDYGQDKLSATTISYKLAATVNPSRHERPTWWEEELHPALVPSLLALAGYVDAKEKQAPPARETFAIPFGAVPLLASLYANGEAPELAKVAADAKQNSATRLTCLLAMHAAGEDLKTDLVLGMLEKEKKMERRLVLLLSLRYSRHDMGVTPVLLKHLEDANDHIRTAAVLSLQTFPAKNALPQLKKILEEQHPEAAVLPVLGILSKMNNPAATQALADFLQKSLDAVPGRSRLYHTLSAFETAVGRRWIEAGAHDDAYYRQKALDALAWWKATR